jgi:thymidylate synthase (FAD)
MILHPSSFVYECQLIELAARICYKSEDRITDESYKEHIKRLIDRGHGAMLEFGNMVVRFVTDRGISHELVRHRLCSFAQESTRYCNYSKDRFGSGITFIQPTDLNPDQEHGWYLLCEYSEKEYFRMLNSGATPQVARSVLPNSLKTEIVVKANFREWRHIFQLRAIEKAAHPDMRNLMIPLYMKCRKVCPEVFEMGDVE